jgi:voltage-gated potassium channel
VGGLDERPGARRRRVVAASIIAPETERGDMAAEHGVGSLRARLVFPVGLLVGVVIVGTVGYRWLWRGIGGTWLDALFMTFTTITTIGYGEVRPLTGVGRVFTMAVALLGIGAFFYTFTVVMEHLVAVRLDDPRGRRRMEQRIDALDQHVILAGLGRVGRQAAQELAAAGTPPFVVIDPSPAAARLAEERGYLLLAGDATEDGVLERAGVRRARGLIATTASDATNLYIVLSARVLNPGLHIVSRAAEDGSVPKLLRAGANRAISPYAIGGHRLAHLILSPAVVDFFETALRRGDETLVIEDVAVSPASAAAGRTLEALAVRQATGASVLAVLRAGAPIPNPPPDLTLEGGDRLLALGTADQLRRLEKLVAV